MLEFIGSIEGALAIISGILLVFVILAVLDLFDDRV